MSGKVLTSTRPVTGLSVHPNNGALAISTSTLTGAYWDGAALTVKKTASSTSPSDAVSELSGDWSLLRVAPGGLGCSSIAWVAPGSNSEADDYFMAGYDNGSVMLWTGGPKPAVPSALVAAVSHDGRITAMSGLNDNQQVPKVVSGSSDGTLIVWTVGENGTLTPSAPCIGHGDAVTDVHGSVSVGVDGQICFWDHDRVSGAHSPVARFATGKERLTAVRLHGQKIAVGAASGDLVVYDVRAVKSGGDSPLYSVKGQGLNRVTGVEWIKDDELVAGGSNGTVKLHSVVAGGKGEQPKEIGKATDVVSALAVDGNGTVYYGSWDGSVTSWSH